MLPGRQILPGLLATQGGENSPHILEGEKGEKIQRLEARNSQQFDRLLVQSVRKQVVLEL